MIDRLRQMAIFAKAIDHGSFRAAADELRLSPSVVSHHISELEAHLGVALMYRTTRKLRLTSEGERLLAATHKMLDAVEGEVNALSATAAEPSGELRITMPSVLSSSPFIDMVAAFLVDYPRVGVEMDFSDERRDLIDGGYDIGGAKSPEDIQDWPWLELAPLKNVSFNLTRGDDVYRLQNRSSQVSCNDAQAVYELARAGVGLAEVPAYLARDDLQARRIEHVLQDWKLDPIQMHLDWPINAPRKGLIKLFVDHMSKSDVVI